jgi:hypothetical protein
VFNPTKGSMDYPLDEFDAHEQIENGYNDSRQDYERSWSKTTNGDVVVDRVPTVKDDASRNKMFDMLEREERKRGKKRGDRERAM